MAENYIKDKLFHYKGVDYSIFAKYVAVDGDEHSVVIKRISDNGKEVYVWDVTSKGWANILIERLILKPFADKSGAKKYGGRAKFDTTDAVFLRECAGWKAYQKNITTKGKESVVTKFVKNKETKPRADWDNVRGDITVNGNVKWNRVDQTFERWSAMSEADLDIVCDLLKKYYGMEEQTQEPEIPMPIPEPEREEQAPDGDNSLLEIFQTFDTPELALQNPTLVVQKMNCLNQIEAMLDSFDDEQAKSIDFINKHLKNRIWFVNPISGQAYIPQINGRQSKDKISKRIVRRELLSMILSLGGIPYFYLGDDIINGLKVDVDGEANYDGNESLYLKIKAEEPNTEYQDATDWKSGGLLTFMDYFGLSWAIQIAKNYLTNYYFASFKYADFTPEFEALFTKIEVEYNDKDYFGNNIVATALMYYRNDGDKWLYILQSGGYSALYSNDFLQGYNLVKSMVTSKTPLYLEYLKDVDGFTMGLMNATRAYPQLLEKYPQAFGKAAGQKFSIPQAILDVKLLLSLEEDPIQYAWLKQELADLELLQSLS